MIKEELLTYLKENKASFVLLYNIEKLGIFGSIARGEANFQSDIDILVEFNPNTPDLKNKKDKLRKLIAEKFGRPVDLCRIKYIKKYYEKQILDTGIYV